MLPFGLLLISLTWFVQANNTSQYDINVLPLPDKYTIGSEVICLSSDFQIYLDSSAPQDLHDAVGRTLEHLKGLKHEYLSVYHGTEFFPDGASCGNWLSSLSLSFEGDEHASESIWDGAIQQPEDRPTWETYHLTVPTNGTGTLSSATAIGLLRGLTTFEALFFYLPEHSDYSGQELTRRWNWEGGYLYAPFGPYELWDKPSFGWRSLHTDTSRNFFSVDKLKLILDAMVMVKFNVFHWHITDSQSWPLDLAAYPELADKGAYSISRKYTEDNIRDVVEYAGHRGIDVLMEIDTPGHTASIFHSHPDYVTCYEKSPWTTYANEPPAGQVRFDLPEVQNFFAGIFEGATSLLRSPFFGTGGDELNQNCMYADSGFNATLAANNWTLENALDEFTRVTHEAVHKSGKAAMVWEEMLLNFNLTSLANDTVIDVWLSSDSAKKVADKGFRLVHASSDYFYLDCGHGEWIGEDGGGTSWCDPFKDWGHIYSFDPYANLTEAQYPLVLGGQVSSWNEQTDETNIEQLLFPRANAAAELFWTGSQDGQYPRNSTLALPRMHDARFRMVDRGVQAEPLQPEWCALRPGMCNIDS